MPQLNFKIFKRFIFLFLIFIPFLIATKWMAIPWQKTIDRLENFTKNYPQEKVHLHTDKPFYDIGEDIWLKAYVVNASSHKPSGISKVLYVDLLNDNDIIQRTATLKIVEGLSAGQLNLPDTLKAGIYKLRAYTKYMLNYGHELIFEKSITIGYIDTLQQITPKLNKQGIQVEFYPEGGDLVNGLRSKIGVKAIDDTGLGIALAGGIYNQHGDLITQFSTEHLGMTVFAFTPQKDERYYATVKLNNNEIQKIDFPKAKEQGYVMAVNQLDDDLIFAIKSKVNTKENLYVIAQAGGMVYTSFGIDSAKNNLSIKVPKSSFPTGIVQFTLFNSKNIPIAERLVFVNHEDFLNIDVVPKKQSFKVKEKAEFAIVAKNNKGIPIAGAFSVSVVDENKVNFDEDNETTLLSNLLLTSELKGYVEKPNYYFNTTNQNRHKHLDYLMLTQGWRRFVWKDILAERYPLLNLLPEQSLAITGEVTTTGGKALAKADMVLVSITPGYQLFLDTLTNHKGHFIFDNLNYPDTVSIIVQAKTAKQGGDVKIKVDQFSNNFIVRNYPLYRASALNYLPEKSDIQQKQEKYNFSKTTGISLNAVEVKAKPVTTIKDSRNLAGVSNYAYDETFFSNDQNFLSAVRRMTGVTVEGNIVKSTRTTKGFPEKLYLIIDGIPIDQDEDNVLQHIHPDDIQGVELLLSPGYTIIYGMEANKGVMHVTTKRGRNLAIPPSTNRFVLRNKGYVVEREFYSPQYDQPQTLVGYTDQRTTIYWNPMLSTTTSGDGKFSFFNSLQASSYKMTIEGLDDNGNLARKVYRFKVEQ